MNLFTSLYSLVCLIFTLTACVYAIESQNDANGPSINSEIVVVLDVQHDLRGDNSWTHRNSLSLTTNRSIRKIALKFDNNVHELSSENANAFKYLMDNRDYYRVRIRERGNEGSWMVASMPACSLAGNRFRDIFRFYFDKNGVVFCFDYVSPTQNIDCNTSAVGDSIRFISKTSANMAQISQVVPTDFASVSNSDPKKLFEMSKGVADGVEDKDSRTDEQKNEQSFLRKYWYLILPFVVMSFLAPAQEKAAPAEIAAQGGSGQKKKK